MAGDFETISGFTPIATNMSLCHASGSTSKQLSHPALVVLCSWMGAAPKHIAKYTAGYQKLYPNTSILLIQSSLGDTFSSDRKLHPRFTVACDAIMRFKSDSTCTGPVVLHTMSNGGGIAATRLARIFRDRGNGFVFDRFICDCMPSRPNVEKGVQAVAIGLPRNRLLRFIATFLVRIWMHLGMFIHCAILRREDILTKLRREMNDVKMFNPAAARLYIYSKNDMLVPHHDVNEHARLAKECGWKQIEEVVFAKALHCGLLMEDADRYWKSVQNLIGR